MERRIVNYRGRVQGVGFRWQAARALESVAVTGYVMNLSDGTVELLIEGAPDSIRQAIDRIGAELRDYIREQSESVAEATGEFGSFGIRRSRFP